MNRIEIEIKLNNDRVWLLETFAALAPEDLTRGITPSGHDPAHLWSAKDHVTHLAGIEKSFNRMISRFLDGDPNPVGFPPRPNGLPLTRDNVLTALRAPADGPTAPLRSQISGWVNAKNEEWQQKHSAKSWSEVVALGQEVRAETLALLARLTDEQLTTMLPGAPWADGTIGAIIAINGDHARRHHGWVLEGFTG